MELTPYLHFEGTSEEVLNFYKEALDGEIVRLNRYKDGPMPVDEDWKDKIMHARLQFGKSALMISDGPKGFKTTVNGNIQLSIEFDDEENMEQVFNKLAEGGRVTLPPSASLLNTCSMFSSSSNSMDNWMLPLTVVLNPFGPSEIISALLPNCSRACIILSFQSSSTGIGPSLYRFNLTISPSSASL